MLILTPLLFLMAGAFALGFATRAWHETDFEEEAAEVCYLSFVKDVEQSL